MRDEEKLDAFPGPPFAPGFVVVLPLFLLYEIGLASDASASHNGAELFLGLLLRPLGQYAVFARWGVLIAAGLFAWHRTRAAQVPIGSLLARTLVEGLACALVLGPLLFALLSFFEMPQVASDLSRRAPGAGLLWSR